MREILNNDASQYGKQPVVFTDPLTGATDLIWDPADPTQARPFGCLLNTGKARGWSTAFGAPDWKADMMAAGPWAADNLPACVIMGPKEIGGGLGLGICNDPCDQGQLGSCVGASGTNWLETRARAEAKQGVAQFLPEIAIRYLYYFAQGYFSRPGGDGAQTLGLVKAVLGYTDGWVNKYAPDMTVGGKCGGAVNERPFDGNQDAATAEGLPYDISACRAGRKFDKKWVELGLKHLSGDSGKEARRARSQADAMQMLSLLIPLNLGAGWRGSWGTVDRSGWCTSNLSRASGGHEFCIVGYCKRPAQSGFGGSNTSTRELAEGNDLWYDLMNSWGKNWAFMGHSMIPAAQFERAGGYDSLYGLATFGSWARAQALTWVAAFLGGRKP